MPETTEQEQRTEERMYYAKTIAQQIGKLNRMCIGYHKPMLMPENDEKYRAGLCFKVNSPRSNQYVEVTLTWADVYNVEYFRAHRQVFGQPPKRTVIAEHDNVYCDQLGELLVDITTQGMTI